MFYSNSPVHRHRCSHWCFPNKVMSKKKWTTHGPDDFVAGCHNQKTKQAAHTFISARQFITLKFKHIFFGRMIFVDLPKGWHVVCIKDLGFMYQEEAQTNHRLVKEKHPKQTMESINVHIQCSAYATTPVLSRGFQLGTRYLTAVSSLLASTT